MMDAKAIDSIENAEDKEISEMISALNTEAKERKGRLYFSALSE